MADESNRKKTALGCKLMRLHIQLGYGFERRGGKLQENTNFNLLTLRESFENFQKST